jgi:hypothetical protein
MTREDVYVVGVSRSSFRFGEPAKVTGVVMCKPKEDSTPRLCYCVEFSDGFGDYIPVESVECGDYDLALFGDVMSGKYKPFLRAYDMLSFGDVMSGKYKINRS